MPFLDIILTLILLIICAYTDTKERKIYNSFTLPIIPLGILNSCLLYGWKDGLMEWLWLIPAFILCFIFVKTHSIGGGDAKLILAVGSLMGMEYTLIILTLSFVLGWFYAAYQVIKQRNNTGGSLKNRQRIMIPLGSIMLVAFGIFEGIQLYMYFM